MSGRFSPSGHAEVLLNEALARLLADAASSLESVATFAENDDLELIPVADSISDAEIDDRAEQLGLINRIWEYLGGWAPTPPLWLHLVLLRAAARATGQSL